MAYHRKIFKDYEPSDVREAYRHAHPKSWQDLISFIESKGLETWHLTPGEDAHLVADARQAMKENVPFTDDWQEAYNVLKAHRNLELVQQEEQRWIEKTREYEQKRREKEMKA
jgi:hypothetical protein